MGSWRDFLEWIKPPAVKVMELEDVLHKCLEENESLRADRARLAKHVQRLEAQLEKSQSQSEARSQKVSLLLAQAKRCKCRS